MDNWKNLFRSVILERGWIYYEDGAVSELEETEKGYSAIVAGSEDYEVEIEIQNGRVFDMWCSCPYAEDGNYCKHMAAVLYEIEEAKENRNELISAKNTIGYSDEKQELGDIISKITEEEIRELLLELALESVSLKNRILTEYADTISERQMLRLKKEIDTIAWEHSDRSGFVDWNNAYGYVRGMEDFLNEKVHALIAKRHYMQAFELTNAVFLTVGNQDMDDSGGESTQLADVCYETWKDILKNCSEAEKKQMRLWFEKNQSAGIVIDYMEDYISEFLVNEFQDEDILMQRLCLLDELIEEAKNTTDCGTTWSIHYGHQNNILERLDIMKRLNYSEEEIKKYKKKNWKFAVVRQLQIAEYMEQKKWNEAIAVLLESKQMDKDFQVWIADYSEKLIHLYKKLNMAEEYKEELIFQVFHCSQNKLDYIELLKAVSEEQEWEAYREQLLTGKTGYSIHYALMEKEGLYERLLDEIAESGWVHTLDQYEKVLKEKLPEKVRDVYVQYVIDEAERVSDRKRYKSLMQYLKKIRKYPDGKTVSNEIAAKWRVLYSRRPAMMDELRKAGFH